MNKYLHSSTVWQSFKSIWLLFDTNRSFSFEISIILLINEPYWINEFDCWIRITIVNNLINDFFIFDFWSKMREREREAKILIYNKREVKPIDD